MNFSSYVEENIREEIEKHLDSFTKVTPEYVNIYFLYVVNNQCDEYAKEVVPLKNGVLTKEDILAEIVKTITYQREDTNKQKNNEIVQINKMLKPGPFYYSKAVGIKIGYTSFSGFNLVAAAVNDEQKLIAVILGSTSPENCYQDARNLFEAAFNKTRDK